MLEWNLLDQMIVQIVFNNFFFKFGFSTSVDTSDNTNSLSLSLLIHIKLGYQSVVVSRLSFRRCLHQIKKVKRPLTRY